MGISIAALFFVAVFVGIPIVGVLGIVAFYGTVVWLHLPAIAVAQQIFMQANNYELLSIPFFISAGFIMSHGGVSRRLVRVAIALLGTLPGSLGVATVASSAFFAGITGSGVADTAAIGSVSIAPMIRQGYKPSFAAGLQAAAGTLGPMFPPSLNAIFLGIVTNQSVGKMLLAILLPGLFMAILLMFAASWLCGRRGYGATVEFRWRELLLATKDAAWGLVMPFLILGSIYSGIFTATEAAALAAFYGIIVSLFVYRELSIRALPKILTEAATLSAIVMILIATATAFSWTMTAGNVTRDLTTAIGNLNLTSTLLLALMAIFMLVAGAILDQAAAVIILPPLLFPIGLAAGLNPMHLGAVLLTALAIGLVLPPIGLTVAVAAAISKQSIASVYKDAMPFFAVLFVGMLVVIFVPWLSTTLPAHMSH